ncbi:MAG TPA: hypothetical protein VGD37_20450 [Kofleriaceae bacterium]|jgi:hypothetical protein
MAGKVSSIRWYSGVRAAWSVCVLTFNDLLRAMNAIQRRCDWFAAILTFSAVFEAVIKGDLALTSTRSTVAWEGR